jgi:RimJ/RimL family protein N-acetyltransferase
MTIDNAIASVAVKDLAAAVPWYQALLGRTADWSTCDADNTPSVRVIEKNGGILDSEAVSARSGKRIRRYWIERDVTAAQANFGACLA